MPSKKRLAQMARDAQRTRIGAQRYASAGIACNVDRTTGRVIANELRMRLVSVPIEDAKALTTDVYYCTKQEDPYDRSPFR